MLTPSLILFTTLALCHSSPVPSKNAILYDQRQEGQWNVQADLQNFMILIIPTQTSSTPTPGASGGLLDLLSRVVPRRQQLKKLQQRTSPDAMHFIESKTAPYHVDISRSRSHLAKLHPEPVVNAEEIVVANSPAIALVKEEPRAAKTFVFTLPAEEEVLIEGSTKKELRKRKVENKSTMKLLGAEFEQCGPGMERDKEGVCRLVREE